MVPLREFRPLTEKVNLIPFRRKYFFICEGRVTEVKYFKQLIQNRSIIGIKDDTELVQLIKEGEHKDISNPKKLLDLAKDWRKKKKSSGKVEFDSDIDHIILVFDLDSFRNDLKEYSCLLKEIEKEKMVPAVTNPCFEIWLMLHKENSLKECIIPNSSELLFNKRVSNRHTVASKVCSDLLGFNSKNTVYFKDFRKSLLIALEQEKNIEQNTNNMKGRIGSNIGIVVKSMLDFDILKESGCTKK